MTNPNDYKSYESKVRQETYSDADGQIQTHVTRTSEVGNGIESSPDSYRNGYVDGRVSERDREEGLVERDNNNAARGLLIGILLTSIVGLVVGTVFFLNQRDEAPTTVTQPVPVPVPSAKNANRPEKTTIIEKTKEVPVERTKEVPVPVFVPQPQASPAPQTPNAEVSPTSTPQQPATQNLPNQSQGQGSSTPDRGTQNNTSTTTPGSTPSDTSSPTLPTPSQGESSQKDSSNGSSP
jgi:outer membrane biosynthesis protein TonB